MLSLTLVLVKMTAQLSPERFSMKQQVLSLDKSGNLSRKLSKIAAQKVVLVLMAMLRFLPLWDAAKVDFRNATLQRTAGPNVVMAKESRL